MTACLILKIAHSAILSIRDFQLLTIFGDPYGLLVIVGVKLRSLPAIINDSTFQNFFGSLTVFAMRHLVSIRSVTIVTKLQLPSKIAKALYRLSTTKWK